jgi:hypothetical protein
MATTSSGLSPDEKKNRVTKIAQELMDLSQKIYNMYGNIMDEDKIKQLEEARRIVRTIVSGMRW